MSRPDRPIPVSGVDGGGAGIERSSLSSAPPPAARLLTNLSGPSFGSASRPRPGRRWLGPGLAIAGFALLLGAIALMGTGFTWAPYPGSSGAEDPSAVAGASFAASPAPTGGIPAETKQQRAQRRALKRRLAGIGPGGTYIVIESASNRLWVRRGEKVLVDAVVSTGSGLVLKQVDADRTWTFDTPRGMHRIHKRIENPVWVKPDWAFLEEGEPVPARSEERYDYGALGEYGLYFGDGYIIHGTLYENLLGRSVSHGCVRVGREDLREVWKHVPLGTPVIVY